MDLHLSGKRAVVTGGSRGIGFAIADALAAEGAEIALLARDPDRLAAAAGRLRERGGRVLALSADTTDDKAVRAAIAQVAEESAGWTSSSTTPPPRPGRPRRGTWPTSSTTTSWPRSTPRCSATSAPPGPPRRT